jgi:NADPH:quinone reductase
MKAIQISQIGGPEVMNVREIPTPEPGKGQVLIRVSASGVNFIDIFVRVLAYSHVDPESWASIARQLPASIGMEGRPGHS